MNYKLFIDTKNDSWAWYNAYNMSLVDLSLNPYSNKIFNGDIINAEYVIIESPARTESQLPGILLLTGKTYGRSKNNTGKLYYKCIPNDKHLPAFLVLYEEKHTKFDKFATNKYIIFKYKIWDDKHPVANIVETIGDVTDVKNFYDYQLYCKNLRISLKGFTKAANDAYKNLSDEHIILNIMKKYNIENRCAHRVISIDPKHSTDLDDAMSICENVLSVYIANVPLLLEFMKLWPSFSNRISTIYLPDRKRPMLPSLLSENLCSLLEKGQRFAFGMDIVMNDNSEIIDIQFRNTLINVVKNYDYDDRDLNSDDTYQKILTRCRILCKHYKHLKEIRDSHDLIAYLMILMNSETANVMFKFKDGIYRSLINNTTNTANTTITTNKSDLPDEVSNIIEIWQSSSGQYCDFNNKENHGRIGVGLDNYIHITSPIRRLIDLLNILKIQERLNLIEWSDDAGVFYTYWKNKLDYINVTMRSIKKLQSDCNLLNLCTNSPDTLKTVYSGYVFDKLQRVNKYLQYMVYIPELKIISRVNIKTDIEEYSKRQFKIYIFEDGLTFKRKIRIAIYE